MSSTNSGLAQAQTSPHTPLLPLVYVLPTPHSTERDPTPGARVDSLHLSNISVHALSSPNAAARAASQHLPPTSGEEPMSNSFNSNGTPNARAVRARVDSGKPPTQASQLELLPPALRGTQSATAPMTTVTSPLGSTNAPCPPNATHSSASGGLSTSSSTKKRLSIGSPIESATAPPALPGTIVDANEWSDDGDLLARAAMVGEVPRFGEDEDVDAAARGHTDVQHHPRAAPMRLDEFAFASHPADATEQVGAHVEAICRQHHLPTRDVLDGKLSVDEVVQLVSAAMEKFCHDEDPLAADGGEGSDEQDSGSAWKLSPLASRKAAAWRAFALDSFAALLALHRADPTPPSTRRAAAAASRHHAQRHSSSLNGTAGFYSPLEATQLPRVIGGGGGGSGGGAIVADAHHRSSGASGASTMALNLSTEFDALDRCGSSSVIRSGDQSSMTVAAIGGGGVVGISGNGGGRSNSIDGVLTAKTDSRLSAGGGGGGGGRQSASSRRGSTMSASGRDVLTGSLGGIVRDQSNSPTELERSGSSRSERAGGSLSGHNGTGNVIMPRRPTRSNESGCSVRTEENSSPTTDDMCTPKVSSGSRGINRQLTSDTAAAPAAAPVTVPLTESALLASQASGRGASSPNMQPTLSQHNVSPQHPRPNPPPPSPARLPAAPLRATISPDDFPPLPKSTRHSGAALSHSSIASSSQQLESLPRSAAERSDVTPFGAEATTSHPHSIAAQDTLHTASISTQEYGEPNGSFVGPLRDDDDGEGKVLARGPPLLDAADSEPTSAPFDETHAEVAYHSASSSCCTPEPAHPRRPTVPENHATLTAANPLRPGVAPEEHPAGRSAAAALLIPTPQLADPSSSAAVSGCVSAASVSLSSADMRRSTSWSQQAESQNHSPQQKQQPLLHPPAAHENLSLHGSPMPADDAPHAPSAQLWLAPRSSSVSTTVSTVSNPLASASSPAGAANRSSGWTSHLALQEGSPTGGIRGKHLQSWTLTGALLQDKEHGSLSHSSQPPSSGSPRPTRRGGPLRFTDDSDDVSAADVHRSVGPERRLSTRNSLVLSQLLHHPQSGFSAGGHVSATAIAAAATGGPAGIGGGSAGGGVVVATTAAAIVAPAAVFPVFGMSDGGVGGAVAGAAIADGYDPMETSQTSVGSLMTQRRTVLTRSANVQSDEFGMTTVNDYLIGDKIGSGSYGTVFLGERMSNSERVAIKCIRRHHLFRRPPPPPSSAPSAHASPPAAHHHHHPHPQLHSGHPLQPPPPTNMPASFYLHNGSGAATSLISVDGSPGATAAVAPLLPLPTDSSSASPVSASPTLTTLASQYSMAQPFGQPATAASHYVRSLTEGHAQHEVNDFIFLDYNILKEVAIMKQINNKHIVRLYEAILDPQERLVYLVMQYVGGGCVLERVKFQPAAVHAAEEAAGSSSDTDDDSIEASVARMFCEKSSSTSSSSSSAKHRNEARLWSEHAAAGDQVYHKLPRETVIKYLRQIVSGLTYLHAKGILHRDIKPENILLDEAKQYAFLADFGVSEICRDGAQGDVGKVLIGTPYFMAPELFESAEKTSLSGAVDVWALGVTCFAMITGRLPFFGRTEDDIRNAVLTSEPSFPADMDADLVDLLKAMLKKNPSERITTESLRILRLSKGFSGSSRGQTAASALSSGAAGASEAPGSLSLADDLANWGNSSFTSPPLSCASAPPPDERRPADVNPRGRRGSTATTGGTATTQVLSLQEVHVSGALGPSDPSGLGGTAPTPMFGGDLPPAVLVTEEAPMLATVHDDSGSSSAGYFGSPHLQDVEGSNAGVGHHRRSVARVGNSHTDTEASPHSDATRTRSARGVESTAADGGSGFDLSEAQVHSAFRILLPTYVYTATTSASGSPQVTTDLHSFERNTRN